MTEKKETSTSKRTRDRSPAPDSNSRSFPPEVIARLAVQILKLDPNGIPALIPKGFPVSEPWLNKEFSHALKRAQLLLKEAAGDTDGEIHAYQVFQEGESLQSFEEIAKRMSEAGWKKLASRNTVEDTTLKIVEHADEKVGAMERFDETILSQTFPDSTGNFTDIRSKLRDHVREVLQSAGLAQVLNDSSAVADKVGTFMIQQILREVDLDPPVSKSEEMETRLGYAAFETYVLEPPSFRQFLAVPASGAKEARKLRPYEIFLYASQNHLLSDKLVRKRRSLNSSFIPYPPHGTYLPILIHHKMHPFNSLEADSE